MANDMPRPPADSCTLMIEGIEFLGETGWKCGRPIAVLLPIFREGDSDNSNEGIAESITIDLDMGDADPHAGAWTHEGELTHRECLDIFLALKAERNTRGWSLWREEQTWPMEGSDDD